MKGISDKMEIFKVAADKDPEKNDKPQKRSSSNI